jgi:hypothetical protein
MSPDKCYPCLPAIQAGAAHPTKRADLGLVGWAAPAHGFLFAEVGEKHINRRINDGLLLFDA